MNSEELKKLYQDGERNFSGVNLRSANLANCNLSNIDLSNANLKFTNFYNADLSYSNLTGADLSKARFENTNLQNADLSNANLQKADLTSANLSNANLKNTDMAGAESIDANFSGVDLSKTKNAVTVANISSVEEDNPNVELLNSLKKATSDIGFSSEGYYPYEFFIWTKENHGKFSIQKLVEVVGHESKIISSPVNIPLKNSIDYESYNSIAEEYKVDDEEDFYFLHCDPVSLAERDLYAKYHIFDYFFGFIYENPDNLRWETFEKYKKFADIVLDSLVRIKIYRVGEIQVHVYLIGEAKNGDLIGIHSISIET